MTRQSAARSVTVRSVSSGTILGERPFVQRNALNASGPAARRIANGCAYFGPLADGVALKVMREFARFRNSDTTNVRHGPSVQTHTLHPLSTGDGALSPPSKFQHAYPP